MNSATIIRKLGSLQRITDGQAASFHSPGPKVRINRHHQEFAMTINDRIEINPRIMLGKPVVRGTRITVELILRKLAEGATEDDLVDAYPTLKKKDIKAAIIYAADTLAHEETLLLGGRK